MNVLPTPNSLATAAVSVGELNIVTNNEKVLRLKIQYPAFMIAADVNVRGCLLRALGFQERFEHPCQVLGPVRGHDGHRDVGEDVGDLGAVAVVVEDGVVAVAVAQEAVALVFVTKLWEEGALIGTVIRSKQKRERKRKRAEREKERERNHC